MILYIKNKPYILGFSLLAIVLLLYCAATMLAGGSAVGFVVYVLLSALLIFCPGLALCDLLLPKMSVAGRFSVSYTLGVAVLWVGFVLFGSLVELAPWVIYLMYLPSFSLAGYKIWHTVIAKKPTVKPENNFVFNALMLCIAAGIFVYIFTGVFPLAHADVAGNMQYHQDMMWSVGNGVAVRFGSPLVDMRSIDGFLYYHYLSDTVVGFISLVGNLSVYNAACYYNYPILVAVLSVGLYAVGSRFNVDKKIAVLLPFGLLFLHGFGGLMSANYTRNYNGVMAASALSSAVLYLLALSLDNKFNFKSGIKFCLGFVLAISALLMSKNLYGILILCAVAATVIFSLIVSRRLYRFQLLLAALGGLVFLLLWQTIFRFALNNLVMEIWKELPDLLYEAFIWAPFCAILYVISLVSSLKNIKKLSFMRLLVNAAAVGGMLAYFLFFHYSSSQTYFLLAAIYFMWFCGVELLPSILKNRRLIAVSAIVAVVTLFGTATMVLPEMRTGVQVALRCLELRPQYPYYGNTVTAGDEQAALWLKENTDRDEIFATNRNAQDMEIGEGTWHYYTAVSERRSFAESWRYAMDYGTDYFVMRHNLEEVSDVLFRLDTTDEAFALAREYDIDYLLMSTAVREHPFDGADPVYENESVRIYRVE